MTNRPTLRNSLGFILIALALSACGGGGGGSSGGSNNFVTANSSSTAEVTKPEATSSEASSSSSAQSTTSSAASSLQSLSSSSQTSQTSLSSSSNSSRTIYSKDAIAPSAPDVFTAPSKLIHSVTLSWSASIDNVAVIYYRIYRNQVLINTVWAPDNQYVDLNVQADTTYTYGISAGDSSSNWSPIKSIVITTPSATASSSSAASSAANSSTASSAVSSSSQSSSISDTTAPSVPANLSLNGAYSDHVSISWSSSTDDVAVTNYKIYRDATLIATLTSAQLSYTDTGTSAQQQYTYSISAGDAAGNWSASKSLFVTTPNAALDGTVNLYWSAPTQRENGTAIDISELGGYELHYKPSGATRYTTIMLSSANTSYSIANLPSGYEFEIAAYDKNQFYSQFTSLSPQ